MDFTIKQGTENMQLQAVCKLVQSTYWGMSRSDETVEKSLQGSECFGAFLSQTGEQIGFARLVTDYSTFYWLCDVTVDEAHRGQGVGKKLVETITSSPIFRQLPGMLRTRDAHGLYEQYGFVKTGDEFIMIKTV
ncbi:MAG: GNAT family N-acetyltransferase [Eubacteriaceae bacterium]|nr:GNAT family N-acetyltransferase [Eubacteriaceae bacterium]